MSGVDVCVVCNADAESESWSSYIVQQASLSSSSASSVSSRTLLDTELTRPASADTLRTARVVVVVVSAGHLEYLRRRCADPERQMYGACSPDRGLVLLCGVEDSELDQLTASGRAVSEQFPQYRRWQRVHHDVPQSELAATLRSVMSGDRSGVKLLQTTARCEEESLMVLSFAKELPQSATVDVVLSDSAAADSGEPSAEQQIAATRVNPFTYTFHAPSDHKVGEVSVEVRVDRQVLASLSMFYVSVSPLVADVTQVYMHLLNTVCSQLVPQTGISRPAAPSAVNVDEKLSSLFDDDVSSSVPAQAFEQLFGAHRYDVDMDKDYELPTLIHFAAKFGFKELCARLIDLPDASHSGKFTNCNGQRSNEIAELYHHNDLRRFLENFLEMDTEFKSMSKTSYYNEKGDTLPGEGPYQNIESQHSVDKSTYMSMDRHLRQVPEIPTKAREAIADDVGDRHTAVPGRTPPPMTTKPCAVDARTPAARGAADARIPASQQELVDIMELVKANKIRQSQADILFQEWKRKQEGGRGKSFSEKQERLAKLKEAVRQARSETQSVTATKPKLNDRLSDASVGSRTSTASRSSTVSTSGVDTDYDEPPTLAAKPPMPQRRH